MPLDIILINPGRRFVTNRHGLGYQVPLGLVFIGGPLLDAGHSVRLVDNDVLGLPVEELAKSLAAHQPDCVMISHAGSMPAHACAVDTIRALRRHLPETMIAYGGVYPTLAHERVMAEVPELDIIGHGEGEATVVDLAAALEKDRTALGNVRGVSWRKGGTPVTNASRPPIDNLDQYRPGWELLDWKSYNLFGFGRASGMQFSRGCIHRCTFCSQWRFWRGWRHRSPGNFAAEIAKLVQQYGVGFVWLADEFFAADEDAARQALVELKNRRLGVSLNLNMTARSVVDSAELLPLYKSAGVSHVVLGVETVKDDVVARIRKDNSFDLSKRAVRLLADHGIVSTASMIFGLEDESLSTLRSTLGGLLELDPDIFNACYVTPLPETDFCRQTRSERIIEPDTSRWTYRTPVVATPHMPTWQLFAFIKFCELLFHLQPRALKRFFLGRPNGGSRFRMILRGHYRAGAWVILDEIVTFLRLRRLIERQTSPRSDRVATKRPVLSLQPLPQGQRGAPRGQHPGQGGAVRLDQG